MASPSGVVSISQCGAGPGFFGNPFFCDQFGFFGFNQFFFASGLCPFCPSPSLGLPPLAVDGLGFGFGPPFFLPFASQPFFGPTFFRRRFFRQRFFGAPFFFPAFFTGVESEEAAGAPAEQQEPDPAIIPSNNVWGGPSDADSMAAAPSRKHPRTTLLVLADGSVYGVVDYWLGEDWRVYYVTSYGGRNSVPLDQVDVLKSMQVNMVRGTNFLLEPGPHAINR
jgi:hypothetical protein